MSEEITRICTNCGKEFKTRGDFTLECGDCQMGSIKLEEKKSCDDCCLEGCTTHMIGAEMPLCNDFMPKKPQQSENQKSCDNCALGKDNNPLNFCPGCYAPDEGGSTFNNWTKELPSNKPQESEKEDKKEFEILIGIINNKIESLESEIKELKKQPVGTESLADICEDCHTKIHTTNCNISCDYIEQRLKLVHEIHKRLNTCDIGVCKSTPQGRNCEACTTGEIADFITRNYQPKDQQNVEKPENE